MSVESHSRVLTVRASEREYDLNSPTSSLPAGWYVYTPPEGYFSVAVPAEPSTVKMTDQDDYKFRTYLFRKGDACFAVVLIFDRIVKVRDPSLGPSCCNRWDTPDGIRADPNFVAGSDRNIVLGEFYGMEYRAVDPDEGECVHRFYRLPDGSTLIGLRVIKPQLVSSSETQAFFESFRFMPR